MKRNSIAFACGLLFGAGLLLSGMTKPTKVLGFLDVFGAFDPSLIFVMIGAIAVYASAYLWTKRRSSPLLAARFQLPTERRIDAKLVAGAAIFGVGWGLSGYCPGPSVVSLPAGGVPVLLFVIALISGSLLTARLERAFATREHEARDFEAG